MLDYVRDVVEGLERILDAQDRMLVPTRLFRLQVLTQQASRADAHAGLLVVHLVGIKMKVAEQQRGDGRLVGRAEAAQLGEVVVGRRVEVRVALEVLRVVQHEKLGFRAAFAIGPVGGKLLKEDDDGHEVAVAAQRRLAGVVDVSPRRPQFQDVRQGADSRVAVAVGAQQGRVAHGKRVSAADVAVYARDAIFKHDDGDPSGVPQIKFNHVLRRF
eukprot:scaffold7052_cov254-Pinguiococcus_pyrenoidosus.AAC.109